MIKGKRRLLHPANAGLAMTLESRKLTNNPATSNSHRVMPYAGNLKFI
jgi:hypothetical protein